MTQIHILGYARGGKEFEVMDALCDLGIDVWRGEVIEFERRGKQRLPGAYSYPALPNYIFASLAPGQLHHVVSIRNMAPTVDFISRGAWDGFTAFRQDAEARLAEAKAIIATSERLARENMRASEHRRHLLSQLAQYKTGQGLEIRDGVLAGEIARFTRLVQHSWAKHPMIEVECEFMGRPTRVEVDPLSVRKVV
jgi:transcription antitermination factor NusG